MDLLYLLVTLLLAPITQAADCAANHIIIARASTEQPGPGVIGSLATLVTQDFPGTTMESVVYPATLENYANSSAMGTAGMKKLLTTYVDACPTSKVVLMGYSQGAHVVGDVMCGGGGIGGSAMTPPVDAKYGDSVKAMIQMGDPRFVLGKSYNVGTATSDGLFPRQANMTCDKYAEKIQLYCDDGDPFCEKGDTLEVHLNYTKKYNEQARAFVKTKLT
ncbi:hypothetical protein HYFRA_00010861 [Hymenoscyphus fraxineus]|uniref:Acetylxylan esterase n=1 Tax=Hymenoscyphus fraxineus TaxID=746836 RepID=A0A9N9PS79_9HELO|nr:hypothetical protein HYFRA_00010861 [Hymenoscyphus fraxineus]